MTEESSLYFEQLSLWNCLVACSANGSARRAFRRNARPIHYIDASRVATRLLLPLLRLVGVEVRQLQFAMRDLKDERGELVRLRIARKDLFDAQAAALSSDSYRQLSREGWPPNRLKDYVDKGMFEASIMDPESPARALYLIEVIGRDAATQSAPRPLMVLRARPWFEFIRRHAALLGVELLPVSAFRVPGSGSLGLRRAMYRFPRLYTLMRNRKENGRITRSGAGTSTGPKLFLDGRGDVNLSNDGHHSDFFWQLNSSFAASDIVYPHRSEAEREALVAHGVALVNGQVSFAPPATAEQMVPQRAGQSAARERRLMQTLVAAYRSTRTYWRSVFRANDIKLWLTWFKYDSYHIAASDAIADCGGISLCWPVAFEGFRTLDMMTNTNILFSYSRYAAEIARECGSVWDYNIITGYPRDYAGALLREEALRLRERMQAAGAEKIVFVIDENSADDARWHTGHELQRENYRFILQKVLDTPWLGAIFKPKVARTLRRRLGPDAELLRAAEATGRCFVYETSGRHTTSAPPLLGGLSADVCIHGHLSAGTAALECALEGLPTLLIDREGAPDSKFYDLPVGKVVFKSWPDAIEAVMQHFESPGSNPGFGDWTPLLGELDPFRDGKAADRMGTYLQWLLDGFREGKDRAIVMAEAAARYRTAWGDDKVLSASAAAGVA